MQPHLRGTFLKSPAGVYLSAEPSLAHWASDWAGYTDHELPWSNSAAIIARQDARARALKPFQAVSCVNLLPTRVGWRTFVTRLTHLGDGLLRGALREVSGGHPIAGLHLDIDPERETVSVGDGLTLTRKEFEVARGFYWGLTRTQVADRLQLTVKAVDYYRQSLRKRFQARSTQESARAINESGLACILVHSVNPFDS